MFAVQINASPLSALLTQLFQPFLSSSPVPTAQTTGTGVTDSRKATAPTSHHRATASAPKAVSNGSVFAFQSQLRGGQDAGYGAVQNNRNATRHTGHVTATAGAATASKTVSETASITATTSQDGTSSPVAQATSSVTANAQQQGNSQAGLSTALAALARVADRIAQGETVTQTLLDEVAAETLQSTASAADTSAPKAAENQSHAAAQAYRETRIMLEPLKRVQAIAADWSGNGTAAPAAGPAVTTGGLSALSQSQFATLQQRVSSMFGLNTMTGAGRAA